MFDRNVACPACQMEASPHAQRVDAVPGPLTATLIAIPTALWACLVMAGGLLFGPPVLVALALQAVLLSGVAMAAARPRPARPRRDRPRPAVGLE